MSIALVAFYTKDFEYNALLLKNSALKNGFTHVIMYTPEDIEPLFDPTICKTQRGYGYFGWKPYIILDVISKLEKLLDKTLKDTQMARETVQELERLRTENLELQKRIKETAYGGKDMNEQARQEIRRLERLVQY